MKKTIFFDVDNTLVCREKNKINDSTIKAIEALIRKEINVAIATGRSLAMVKQESFYKMFKTIISANGSLITVKDEVIYKKYMNKKVIKKLVSYFENNDIPYCIHLLDKSMGTIDKQWVKNFSEKYTMKIEKIEENILDNLNSYEIFQINAHIKDNEIEKFKEEYKEFSFVKLIDVEEGYDIFNKSCNKGSAIKYIKENNKEKDIVYYAFGDGFNDLEMFHEVDYGISMGNGCRELKEKAYYVTNNINEDGVYNALKKLEII